MRALAIVAMWLQLGAATYALASAAFRLIHASRDAIGATAERARAADERQAWLVLGAAGVYALGFAALWWTL